MIYQIGCPDYPLHCLRRCHPARCRKISASLTSSQDARIARCDDRRLLEQIAGWIFDVPGLFAYQIHVRKCPKRKGLVGDRCLEGAILCLQVGHTAQPSRSKLMLKKWWLIHDTLFECIQNHPTCLVGDGWGSKEKRQTPRQESWRSRRSWWTFWYIHRYVFLS